jgi:hypothetical protein
MSCATAAAAGSTCTVTGGSLAAGTIVTLTSGSGAAPGGGGFLTALSCD